MPNILAEGIKQYAHIAAFDRMAEVRSANLDLSVLLVKLIDLTPAALLPFHAEELGVLGYKGWIFADTDLKKRNLLKSALLLHRKAGTGFAIRRALAVIGFPDAVIIEHMPSHYYNGQYYYNGTINYGSYHWANFRVILPLPVGGVNPTLISNIKNVIEAWKRLVCHLVDVQFSVAFDEVVTVTDTLEWTRVYAFNDSLGHNYYNGAILYNGAYTYANNYEDLAITI
jgi:hypothetical protein